MLSAVNHLGVAVSGGADSVVLLHILHSLLQGTGRQLTILHVNHQLRGAESDADEQLVRSWAQTLHLPILCSAAPVMTGNLEQEARRGRQRFFQNCREHEGIDRIALGHTRSDQAETILFRLLRGSGLAGLAGMAPVTRSGLIRPLLFTSRDEVREFAKQSDLSWREDASNQNLKFRRNRLRLKTIPQLSHDYNPGLEKVLARTAEIAQAEETYWEFRMTALYRRLVSVTPTGVTLPVLALKKLHLAQQRRLLRRCLAGVRQDLCSIDLSHIDGILKICESGHGHDRLMVPGIDAIRSFETLLLTGPDTMKQARGYKLDVPLCTRIDLPFHTGHLIVDPTNTEEENYVTVKSTSGFLAETAYLNRELVGMLNPGGSLIVRNWEPGDLFRSPGSSRPEKIKTLFQENRVLLWERRHWPVLVVGGEIAWARGFGSDAKFSPALGTKSLLRVRFEQPIYRSKYGK